MATPPAICQGQTIPWKKEYVVKDVLLPNPVIPGENIHFGFVRHLADTDQDGLSEFIAQWVSVSSSGPPTRRQQILTGKTLLKDGIDVPSSLNSWFYNRIARLKNPGGCLQTSSIPLTNDVGVFSERSRKQVGLLTIPPPAYTIELVTRCGDLNQDGWDDLFVYPYSGQVALNVGLIDGKTNSIIWNDIDHSVLAWSAYPVLTYSNSGTADLDGDGSADFLVSYSLAWAGGTSPFQMYFRAYSGLSGAVLWSKTIDNPDNAGFFTNLDSDLNGDGTPDLTVLEPFSYDHFAGIITDGQLSAFDGGDGSLLWEVTIKHIDPKWETGISIYDYYTAQYPVFPTPDLDGDGIDEVSFSVQNTVHNSNPSTRRLIATFSGKDGCYLGRSSLPDLAVPWLSERLDTDPASQVVLPIGDIDNDGWQELALGVPAPDFNQIGGTAPPPTSLVILSHPSMVVDAKAELGEDLNYSIHIPSGKGMAFEILASTEFKARTGKYLDGWNSQLGASPILNFLMATHPFRGTLDNSGKAQGSIPIPSLSFLSGTRLYLKAVILDSGNPQKVQCLTNLCWTDVK